MDPSSTSATRALANNILGDEVQAGIEVSSTNQQPPPHEAATTTKETKLLKGMDLNIFTAATQGNIEALKEHKDILHQILTPTKNTVLHVYIAYESSSAAATTDDFPHLLENSISNVKKILELCPPLLLQRNKNRDTVLHVAARYGRADIVELLMQDAKGRDRNGDNLEDGFGKQWQRLIRSKNCDEDTALHEAVRFNHLEVVKLLTKEDPEFVYTANKAGETPLYLAAERGHYDLVCEILDNCRCAAYQGPNCTTALHGAVISNNEKMTRKLLEKHKNMTQEADEQGWTPLHLAANMGHSTVTRLLLEWDTTAACIREKQKKRTPLHLAASNGHVDVMKEIILRCPDCCELVDYKRQNVLHYAIQKHQLQVEKFVRKDPWLSHVLLNGKDVGRNTPLHDIAYYPYKEATDFIRDARVDKMSFNKENLNAINIIEENNGSSPWKIILRMAMEETGAYHGYRIPNPDEDGERKVHVNKNDNDLRYNVSKKKDLKEKEIKESHMVVSALISTVTFAAGFTVPGGYVSEKGPDQGSALLSRNVAFKAFVIANTLAMSMSSCAVMIRFFLLLRRRELTFESVPYGLALDLTLFALIAMVVAFLTGTYAVLGSHSSLGLAIAATVLGCFFFFGLGAFMFLPAFATLRGCAATIYQHIHVFLYHFLHGNFLVGAEAERGQLPPAVNYPCQPAASYI